MDIAEPASRDAHTRRVLITGATGFIGRSLSHSFADQGWQVHATSRDPTASWDAGTRGFTVEDGTVAANWQAALNGVDLVVHCAARVHVLQEQSGNPLAEFRRVNVDATLALARAAAAAGARRFIFLSTVGVHGGSSGARPIHADDAPSPHTPYAQSKLEAEVALREWSRVSGVELVCIRPPLVYGPDAPGNFGRLLSLIRRGLPLPLGAVHNLRSIVAVDNLASLVLCCADHPAASGRAFLVSDGHDLSTTSLLRLIAQADGRHVSLLPVPVPWLRAALALLGRQAMAEQLLGDLQVDITETCKTLQWSPPFTLAQALKAVDSRRQPQP